MIYFGKEVHVCVEGEQAHRFSCQRCGSEQGCIVAGRGTGDARNPFFLDPSGARARADSSAEIDFKRSVAHVLALATCNRCQRRSPTAVRRFWLRFFGIVAIFAAGAFGVPALMKAMDGDRQLAQFFSYAFLVALPVFAGYELWRNWVTVDRRIRFVGEQTTEAEPG
jgi:hypothetical protein